MVLTTSLEDPSFDLKYIKVANTIAQVSPLTPSLPPCDLY
jgi:hypothetical protein